MIVVDPTVTHWKDTWTHKLLRSYLPGWHLLYAGDSALPDYTYDPDLARTLLSVVGLSRTCTPYMRISADPIKSVLKPDCENSSHSSAMRFWRNPVRIHYLRFNRLLFTGALPITLKYCDFSLNPL
jgi:hypothetical protein